MVAIGAPAIRGAVMVLGARVSSSSSAQTANAAPAAISRNGSGGAGVFKAQASNFMGRTAKAVTGSAAINSRADALSPLAQVLAMPVIKRERPAANRRRDSVSIGGLGRSEAGRKWG